MHKKKNIVILGAGYGGIMTTKKLQKMLRGHEAEITLVNINDYHYQATWLHENAAGTLHHDRSRVDIKDVIDLDKVNFIKDRVLCIKPEKKTVKLERQEIGYDILVVALGFEAATFGIPGLEEHAFTISDINSARLLREHLEYNFALYHNEREKNSARLNIVVGGGGFTGIEYIGELANRIPRLCEEYDIEKSQVRMINLEATPSILPNFDQQLIEYATNSLEARGVEFITGAVVKECRPDRIIYEKDGKEEEVPTMTTVWAAGVKANSIVEKAGLETIHGKVEVRKDMRAPEYDEIFVMGDCALIRNPDTGTPYPPTAQIAIQQSSIVAHNVRSLIHGGELKDFKPTPLGTIASLGNNDAVATVFHRYQLRGWKATAAKRLSENRYLLKLGGVSLLMKKGKFNFFY
ncbi:NAD(P)/FAD-dependent oxidoreductase [Virgibacillus xinjiangensis]|uniref:NAD(P)/FAD-dependent oxidoreductase n=1 Tax=Virgibacillus xinjiangensis TaxID=393090 RepID=A0ABV7CYC1_9BACI